MSKVSDEKLHELLHRCKQRSGLSYQELDSLAEVCAELTSLRLKSEWRPIESAPRDSGRMLVAYKSDIDGSWRIHEAWWRIPYEGAPNIHGHWCHDGDSVLLSADVHKSPEGRRLGATHWMPLPDPPKVSV